MNNKLISNKFSRQRKNSTFKTGVRFCTADGNFYPEVKEN